MSISEKRSAFSAEVIAGGFPSWLRELGAAGLLFLSLLTSFHRELSCVDKDMSVSTHREFLCVIMVSRTRCCRTFRRVLFAESLYRCQRFLVEFLGLIRASKSTGRVKVRRLTRLVQVARRMALPMHSVRSLIRSSFSSGEEMMRLVGRLSRTILEYRDHLTFRCSRVLGWGTTLPICSTTGWW